MSEGLPCLFCFSRSASPQRTHHPTTAFLQDKPRVQRCYKFLCSLFGIPSTLPQDEERHLLDPFSAIPLCSPCSSTLRNLSDLKDELQNIHRQITDVAENIKSKIRSSADHDGSSSLAFAIHSIAEEGHSSANNFTWMRQFRERVIFSSSAIVAVPMFSQDRSMQSHEFVVVDLSDNQPSEPILPNNVADFGEISGSESIVGEQDLNIQHMQQEMFAVDEFGNEDKKDLRLSQLSPLSDPHEERNRKKKKIKSNSSTTSGVKSTTFKPESSLDSCKKKAETPTRRFKCRYCSKRFLTMFNLRVHLPLHTGQMSYHCDQCKTSFATSSAIQTHNLVAHGSRKPHVCGKCKVERATLASLNYHAKSHSLDKEVNDGPPFLCSICPKKQFSTKKIFKRHVIQIHQTKTKFKCPVCPKQFSRKDDMCRHLMKGHKNAKIEDTPQHRFQCTLCPVTTEFLSSEDLINHVVAHGAMNPIMCFICRIAFITRLELVTHNQQFHGVDPLIFKCSSENCDLTFYTKAQLEAHMKLHKDKASFVKPTRTYTRIQCDHCEKTFCDSSTLKRHLRDIQHKENKIFYVYEDNQLLLTKDIQSLHKSDVGLHVSEAHNSKLRGRDEELFDGHADTYRCSYKYCVLSFASTANLNRHIKYVHESDKSQRFNCSDCSASFKRKYDLMKHFRIKGHQVQL